MGDLAIAGVVLACLCAAFALGLWLRRVLPDHHLSSESKDVVKLGIGLVATLSALVLGLLIASAKTAYDENSIGLTRLAAKVVLLDRVLAHYGPEAQKAREELRKAVVVEAQSLWMRPGQSEGGLMSLARRHQHEAFLDLFLQLPERDEAQRLLKVRILQVSTEVGETRFLLAVQAADPIPDLFLLTLVAWLALIFGCFGLLSPRSPTVWVVIGICAFAASGAVFLILELGRPFSGLLRISPEPLQAILESLAK
jgi:hypothetical protein